MESAISTEFQYHLETLGQVIKLCGDVGWQRRDELIPASECRVVLMTLQWYLADRLADPVPHEAHFLLCWLHAELCTLHDDVLLTPDDNGIALNERLWRLTHARYVHKLLELAMVSPSSMRLLDSVSRRLDAVPPARANMLQKVACYLNGYGAFRVYDGRQCLHQHLPYQSVDAMQTVWTDVLACATWLDGEGQGPVRVHAVY